jgi:hypothetical protein
MSQCTPKTLEEYKAFLCGFICSCAVAAPKWAKITGARAMKQACMDGALQLHLDTAGGCVVPEVPYIMTTPPISLMSATGSAHNHGIGTLKMAGRIAVTAGLGQTKEYVESGTRPLGEMAGYSKGLLRIPDVVIMKDCDGVNTDPSNIAYVVEVKFMGDRENKKQNEAYEKIASNSISKSNVI